MGEKFDERIIDRAIATADLKDKHIPRESPEDAERLNPIFDKARKTWRVFILSKNIERSKDKSFEIKFEPLLQTLELINLPRDLALRASDDIVLETPGIVKTATSYKLENFEEFAKFRGSVKAGKELLKQNRKRPEAKTAPEKPKRRLSERERFREAQKEMILILLSQKGEMGVLELTWDIDLSFHIAESLVNELEAEKKVKIIIIEKRPGDNAAKKYRMFVELIG